MRNTRSFFSRSDKIYRSFLPPHLDLNQSEMTRRKATRQVKHHLLHLVSGMMINIPARGKTIICVAKNTISLKGGREGGRRRSPTTSPRKMMIRRCYMCKEHVSLENSSFPTRRSTMGWRS